jgi:hypothetical protein
MKCSACSTPMEKSLYFALEHDAHDVLRVHGGYVYFWAAESAGGESFVKIGHTINLEQRLAAFRRPKPGVVVPDMVNMEFGELYGVISGGRRMEKALHLAFRDEHEVGEWFFMSDRIHFVIDALLDEWCADPCCSEAPHLERRAMDVAMHEALSGSRKQLMGTLQAALDADEEAGDEAGAA